MRWALGVALILWLTAPPAAAQVQQVPIGARAIGMGGAYSSLADDASALFWNPAGLAWIDHQEFAANHADLFGSGIRDNHVALVLPFSARHVVGMDWYRSGFDDGELGFGENRIGAAWSMRPSAWWSAAVTGKYLTRSIDLDGASVRSGSGLGLDVGAIVAPSEGLRFGLVGQDLFDTSLHYDDGRGEAVAYPRTVRIGSSYAWRRLATFALDVDDRWHLGLDFTPIPEVALRAGAQDDIQGDDGTTWSYGLGLKAGAFRVDYAYEQHPMLSGTHHMGVSVNFNLNPALVRIERVEVSDVYASLHRSYADRPVGTARIRNLADRPIEAQVSVLLPGLMDAPTRQTVVLRPKAVQDVPLKATLSPRVMEHSADQAVQVQVGASYPSRRLVRNEKASARLMAYAPGAIDWSQGVAQAAAFVTPRDPIVEAVARDAVRVVATDGAARFGTRNLAYAGALFDALGAFGIAYVPDPNNPFSSISESAHAVDTIQYPGQTLARRSGDCDDTTVLMAALLASVGVNTQMVDAPGHLFLLVDTGVHERNRAGLQVDESLLVVSGDGLWVPIETTAIPKGFSEAWRIGAESFRSWSARDQIELVDVAAAQARYQPSNPSGVPNPPTLDAGRLAESIGRDAEVIAGWNHEWLAKQQAAAPLPGPASATALDEVAHAFFEVGRMEDAQSRLDQALNLDPGSAKLKNNMGLVMACQGGMKAGLDLVLAARQTSPDDPCIWINEGLIRLAAGDSTQGWAALAEGVKRAGGVEGANRMMGLEAAGRGNEDPESGALLRSLLNEAGARPGVRSGGVGSAAISPGDLRRLVCWKE